MNIKEVKKKNGTIVYRANVYLGTDRLTGKKARKNITASTKKAVKTKAREAVNEFINNGYTTKVKATVKHTRNLLRFGGIATKIQLNQIPNKR